MKHLKKIGIMLITFGILYLAFEVCFRGIKNIFINQSLSMIGESSLYMIMVGGIAGVLIGFLNQVKFINNIPILFQVLIGTIIIDIVEFSSGMFLNKLLCFNIWDYSNELLNLYGQISIPHTIGWFALVPCVIWIDDVLRSVIYDEENIYNILDNYKRIVLDFKRK